MENNEVIEGNRLIATFMGISVTRLGNTLFVCDSHGNIDFDSTVSYSPHLNWNDIMPVIHKLKKKYMLYEGFEAIEQALLTLKIELVFESCIDLIKMVQNH